MSSSPATRVFHVSKAAAVAKSWWALDGGPNVMREITCTVKAVETRNAADDVAVADVMSMSKCGFGIVRERHRSFIKVSWSILSSIVA